MRKLVQRARDKYRYSLVVFKELVKTDFQLRYQGSFLGMAWSVLKPLMLFAVMYVVFVRFLKFSDGTPAFHDLSLLCGTFANGLFSRRPPLLCVALSIVEIYYARFISLTTLSLLPTPWDP